MECDEDEDAFNRLELDECDDLTGTHALLKSLDDLSIYRSEMQDLLEHMFRVCWEQMLVVLTIFHVGIRKDLKNIFFLQRQFLPTEQWLQKMTVEPVQQIQTNMFIQIVQMTQVLYTATAPADLPVEAGMQGKLHVAAKFYINLLPALRWKFTEEVRLSVMLGFQRIPFYGAWFIKRTKERLTFTGYDPARITTRKMLPWMKNKMKCDVKFASAVNFDPIYKYLLETASPFAETGCASDIVFQYIFQANE